MAIFITQARFTTDPSVQTTAAPQDRAQAVVRLVNQVEGKLIASYLTSGHYDILLIFEAPSHGKVEAALAIGAAASGLADLKTVRMLATGEMKDALGLQHGESPSEAQQDEAQQDAEVDAKAAAAILEAQRRSVENIQAGRPASYYITSPPVAPAASQAIPDPPATRREDAAKKGKALQSHREQDDGKSV
jgi:uncharacterized protein with GYD domain